MTTRHNEKKVGGVAQLVRACGSYPQGRWFESTRRYHRFLPAGRLICIRIPTADESQHRKALPVTDFRFGQGGVLGQDSTLAIRAEEPRVPKHARAPIYPVVIHHQERGRKHETVGHPGQGRTTGLGAR